MRRLSKLLDIKPIAMHYNIHECRLPNASNSWINIIFLHSMLSSSSTAFPINSFIDPLSNKLCIELNHNIRCYLVDARNHGLSSHSDTFSLESICVDLNTFIDTHIMKCEPLILLGHSMGAKASLLYALLCASDITGLISLDASPTIYMHNHESIFNAMHAVNFSKVHKKYDVDQQLKDSGIINASERGFILDNLEANIHNEWRWKCNLNAIYENEHYIHGFPDTQYMDIYDKYTLFLGGCINSDRLTNPKYFEDLNFWFPNHALKLFDGGHFIHRTHCKQVTHEISQYLRTMLR